MQMNQLTNKEKALLHLTAQALFPQTNELNIDTLKKKNLPAELKEANVQAVFPLVYSVLKKHGITLPDFEKNFLNKVANNIRVGHDHAELHELLSSNNIPYVAMKGSASAMYYQEPLLRTMGDVDFLVSQSDLERAGALLKQAGFHPVEKNEHECHIAYHRKMNGVRSIWEMHWSPSGIPQGEVGELTREYLSDIVETAVMCTTSGSECLIPSPFHHGLIMLLHTAIHLINTGIGLRHLCDWAVFVDKLSDEEFKELFEEKLKSIGMWRFAQILTQLSIAYLGMSPKQWCDLEVEPEYLETLMSDIFKGGNFGVKDSNRINQAKLITNSHKASVDDTGLLKQLIKTMNEKARSAMPVIKKMPILLPVGWIYAGGRHLLRIRRGSRPKIDVSDMVRGATERRELYKEFQLFKPEGHTCVREAGHAEKTKCKEYGAALNNEQGKASDFQVDSMTYNFMQLMKCAVDGTYANELPRLQEPVKWDELVKISKIHNLLPLFHEVACQYKEYRELRNYEDYISTVVIMIGQQIKKTEVFLELYRAFLKEDLRPIVMKGLICRQLYGKNAEKRPSGDEDIFVRREDFYKIKEIMEAHGFVCSKPGVTMAQLEELQDVGFYASKTGFLIEVHTNLMGRDSEKRVQMGDCFGDVFKHAQTVIIRDVPITTMSHTDHFTFLILHAFKHFTLSGVGMRQMLDILLYQRTYKDEIDWEMVKGILEANHATSYMGDLQAIGRRYLGFESPVMFETCSPEELLEDMLEVGVFGKQDVAGTLAGRITLSTIDQKTGRIRTFLRAGFPSLEFMMVGAPHLKEKPWMLPLEWAKRWIRFIKKSRKYDGNLMKDSMEMSQKRKALLEKYGL